MKDQISTVAQKTSIYDQRLKDLDTEVSRKSEDKIRECEEAADKKIKITTDRCNAEIWIWTIYGLALSLYVIPESLKIDFKAFLDMIKSFIQATSELFLKWATGAAAWMNGIIRHEAAYIVVYCFLILLLFGGTITLIFAAVYRCRLILKNIPHKKECAFIVFSCMVWTANSWSQHISWNLTLTGTITYLVLMIIVFAFSLDYENVQKPFDYFIEKLMKRPLYRRERKLYKKVYDSKAFNNKSLMNYEYTNAIAAELKISYEKAKKAMEYIQDHKSEFSS